MKRQKNDAADAEAIAEAASRPTMRYVGVKTEEQQAQGMGEVLVVAALALHLAGGVRILVTDFWAFRARRTWRIAVPFVFAGVVAAVYGFWGLA